MKMRYKYSVLFVNLVWFSAISCAADAIDYRVDCAKGATNAAQCKVDEGTYQGYRIYHSVCLHCHGGGGMGSSFAPSLLVRLQSNPDFAHFKDVTLNGMRGQMGVMAGFAKSPNVANNVNNLYRYLKARADGKLPNGRPERMEDRGATGQ